MAVAPATGEVTELERESSGAVRYALGWPTRQLPWTGRDGTVQDVDLSATVRVQVVVATDGQSATVCLSVETLSFSVDNQKTTGTELGYFVDLVHLTAAVADPDCEAALVEAWPQETPAAGVVDHSIETTTSREMSATVGLEGLTPAVNFTATRGRELNATRVNPVSWRSWRWTASRRLHNIARLAWHMSSWADRKPYDGGHVPAVEGGHPCLPVELQHQVTVDARNDGVFAKWCVRLGRGDAASTSASAAAAPSSAATSSATTGPSPLPSPRPRTRCAINVKIAPQLRRRQRLQVPLLPARARDTLCTWPAPAIAREATSTCVVEVALLAGSAAAGGGGG